MPELPEVETVVRELQRRLPGRRFTRAQVFWERTIANMSPAAFVERIVGRSIEGSDRRAKYVVVRLGEGLRLVVHLRMSGRLLVEPAGEPLNPYTRVALDLDDGMRLVFNDTRKFGRIWLVDQAELDHLFVRLGPEPLVEEFTPQQFGSMLRGKKGALKPLLLDQSFLAGLGNIYVDEALWLAQLHPLRLAGSLDEAETARLYSAIRDVLNLGIENRGTTFAMFLTPAGEPGQNQETLKVYGRAGKGRTQPAQLCERCGTPIAKIFVAQRGTHYCPVCQPTPAEEA